MAAVGAISPSIWRLPPTKIKCNKTPCVNSRKESALKRETHSLLSTFCTRISVQKHDSFHSHFSLKAASSSSVETEYSEEPATKVKFQKSLSIPGFSTSLALTGTGYREKVFAIIGVKVYAAGLYVNQSIFNRLDAWKKHSSADLQQDSAFFDTIFQAPLEKSLQIVLVRDVDGKTFWDALDEAISPRMKSPTPVDTSALSSFRALFQGRSLNKGTNIFLTWLDSTKMLVSVSSDGLPSNVDATIESTNVVSALFDVFLGSDSVSPTLKASVTTGLAALLNS